MTSGQFEIFGKGPWHGGSPGTQVAVATSELSNCGPYIVMGRENNNAVSGAAITVGTALRR